jgi:hypothetical protein
VPRQGARRLEPDRLVAVAERDEQVLLAVGDVVVGQGLDRAQAPLRALVAQPARVRLELAGPFEAMGGRGQGEEQGGEGCADAHGQNVRRKGKRAARRVPNSASALCRPFRGLRARSSQAKASPPEPGPSWSYRPLQSIANQ